MWPSFVTKPTFSVKHFAPKNLANPVARVHITEFSHATKYIFLTGSFDHVQLLHF